MLFNRRGTPFTLIELLTVLAIVMILASFLLPAASEVRAKGRWSLCQANLSQVSIAGMLYSVDFDDYFPTVHATSVLENASRIFGKAGLWPAPGYNSGDRLLNSYVGFNGIATTSTDAPLAVFRCPSDVGRTNIVSPPHSFNPTMWAQMGRSYAYNAYGLTWAAISPGLPTRRLGEVIVPEYIIFAGDGSSTCYAGGDNPNSTYYWHNSREVGWANLLFVDGHVSYEKMTRNQPSFQLGENWSFIYNSRP